jgi:hypothetical protein
MTGESEERVNKGEGEIFMSARRRKRKAVPSLGRPNSATQANCLKGVSASVRGRGEGGTYVTS